MSLTKQHFVMARTVGVAIVVTLGLASQSAESANQSAQQANQRLDQMEGRVQQLEAAPRRKPRG